MPWPRVLSASAGIGDPDHVGHRGARLLAEGALDSPRAGCGVRPPMPPGLAVAPDSSTTMRTRRVNAFSNSLPFAFLVVPHIAERLAGHVLAGRAARERELGAFADRQLVDGEIEEHAHLGRAVVTALVRRSASCTNSSTLPAPCERGATVERHLRGMHEIAVGLVGLDLEDTLAVLLHHLESRGCLIGQGGEAPGLRRLGALRARERRDIRARQRARPGPAPASTSPRAARPRQIDAASVQTDPSRAFHVGPFAMVCETAAERRRRSADHGSVGVARRKINTPKGICLSPIPDKCPAIAIESVAMNPLQMAPGGHSTTLGQCRSPST